MLLSIKGDVNMVPLSSIHAVLWVSEPSLPLLLVTNCIVTTLLVIVLVGRQVKAVLRLTVVFATDSVV